MTLINFILDIAGLLLWLSWRSIPFDPLTRAAPATLVGTVRRAEPPRLRRWHFLAVLAGLLFIRGIFYWQIGPAVNWTPRLDLGVVALAFGGNAGITPLLFSVLSFAKTWILFHFWLLTLAIINGGSAEADPIQKMILLQLGWIARWPRVVQLIAPALFCAAIWIAVHPLLAWVGVVHRAQSTGHLLGQAAVLGASLYFTLKNLLPGILFLYGVASYVYLGSSPFWHYLSATSRRILVPLNRIPLRFGRIDFAPLVGIVLILLLLHALPNFVLIQLNRRNLTLWPQ